MSRNSLLDQIVRSTTAITAAALLFAGLATGTLLHTWALSVQDDALLIAAHSMRSPSESPVLWQPAIAGSDIEVRPLRPDEPLANAQWAQDTIEAHRTGYHTVGERRIVLLPIEALHGPEHAAEPLHAHAGILASAPRLKPRQTVGSFALVYALSSGFVLVLAAYAQRRFTTRAFEPLVDATRQIESIPRSSLSTRLDERGPSEIVSILSSFNRLLEGVERTSHAQARLLAEAAHELRTPVAIMLGELEIVQRRERPREEYKALLGSLEEEARRLRDIVEGLMGLARVDSGLAKLGRESCMASSLLDAAVVLVKHAHPEAAQRLQIVVHDDHEMRLHRPLVTMALDNLLRNAVLHAPEGPVRCDVRCQGATVQFVIEDEGPGVPTELVDHLFERFARGGAARRAVPGGLGLGLPLAREVAQAHGGDVRVDPTYERGCRVVLTLPVAPQTQHQK